MDKDKKEVKQKLKLKDLPPALREKYKNHSLFQDDKKQKQKLEIDLMKIKDRKEQKGKSIEEKLKEVTISSTEKKALNKVFILLCTPIQEDEEDKQNKVDKKTAYFEAKDIAKMIQQMGMKLTKSEIDLMLWEVDENLDGRVNWKEFKHMYKRCIMKDSDLEPKSLFHMVQFLMYCCNKDNKDTFNKPMNKFTITVEDTLELLYVRHKRDKLDGEIKAIFGDEEKTSDGQEKEISFAEYLEKINKRAIEERKKKIQEKKNQFTYNDKKMDEDDQK